ncbi:MAG: hypothetical protein QXG97_07425 [Nitrososphaerota archaeon]
MSTQHRRTIAKEIVEQTISHFKKQKESPQVKPATVQVVSKPEEKYEPSTNFHRVFSEVIGAKSKESGNSQVNETPRLKSESKDINDQSKEEETMKSVQNLNERPDLPQQPRKPDEPENKEGNANKPHQPSVFERLSRASIKETSEPKQEEAQAEVFNEKAKQEEQVNKQTRPVSVFEKLSRRAVTN